MFIAVIIETFAEIRVQFQQMWGSHDTASERSSMVCCRDYYMLVTNIQHLTLEKEVNVPIMCTSLKKLFLLICVSSQRMPNYFLVNKLF